MIGGFVFLATAVFALAQFPDNRWDRSRGGYRGWGGQRRFPSRDEFATWEINPEFEHDVFTFVRIHYDSDGPYGWWDRWDNDYPDSDWNFSYRLHQLTSFRVAPVSKVLRLTDPELFDHPFIYMAGVQWITLDVREQFLATGMERIDANGGC